MGPTAALEQGWQLRRRSASNSPTEEEGAAGETTPRRNEAQPNLTAVGGMAAGGRDGSATTNRDSPMNAEVAELARREQQLRARQEAVEERRQERRMSGGVVARVVAADQASLATPPAGDRMQELLEAAYEVTEEGRAW